MHRRAIRLALTLGLVAVGGCAAILEGDSTSGDEGQSRWMIDDGLCPGLNENCNLEVPVVVGATLRVDVVTDCCSPSRFDVVAVGPAEVESARVDGEDRRIDTNLRIDGPGEIILELREGDVLFDRARLVAREAAAMECGVVRGGADWQLSGLDVVSSSTETPDRRRAELGCRLSDADGEPLLSAGAIRWTIVEGPSNATIDSGSRISAGTGASGARIYLSTLGSADTVLLEARYGDLVEMLEITVLDE